MSTSNKKSNTKARATDSKVTKIAKNGIEKFAIKSPSILINNKEETDARKNSKSEGNLKIKENKKNTLSITNDTPENLISNKNDSDPSPKTLSGEDESYLSSSDHDSISSFEITFSTNLPESGKERTLDHTATQKSSLQEENIPLSTEDSIGMVGTTSEKEKCTSKQFSFLDGPPTISTELDRKRHVGVSIEDNLPQDAVIGDINSRLVDDKDSNQGSCFGGTSSTKKEIQKGGRRIKEYPPRNINTRNKKTEERVPEVTLIKTPTRKSNRITRNSPAQTITPLASDQHGLQENSKITIPIVVPSTPPSKQITFLNSDYSSPNKYSPLSIDEESDENTIGEDDFESSDGDSKGISGKEEGSDHSSLPLVQLALEREQEGPTRSSEETSLTINNHPPSALTKTQGISIQGSIPSTLTTAELIYKLANGIQTEATIIAIASSRPSHSDSESDEASTPNRKVVLSVADISEKLSPLSMEASDEEMGEEELMKKHGQEGQYGTDKKISNNQTSTQDKLEISAGDRNDDSEEEVSARSSELAPESEEDPSLSPNSVSDEEELLLFQRGTQTQAQFMKENPIQDKSGLKDLIDRKVHSIPLPGEV